MNKSNKSINELKVFESNKSINELKVFEFEEGDSR